MGGGVACSISPSVEFCMQSTFGFPTLLKNAVISEYAQNLFSEASAQASIRDGSTMKAEAMNCSAKIYFEEGCMFQCTSNTKGWYNHDLHGSTTPATTALQEYSKLEKSTHSAQERSQRSLCSMHSEAKKSRQVWGGCEGIWISSFLHLSNHKQAKLPSNPVVFGRQR